VDQALSRLTRAREINRLGRGLYYYPQVNERLGIPLTPEMDEIAEAVARQTGSQVVPSGVEAQGHRFWGYKRLERIMTHAQIRAALLGECGFGGPEADTYCNQILPQQSSTCPSYLRIFAILILAEMGHDIGKFLHPPLSDSQFSMDTDVDGLLTKQKVGVKWKPRDWDSFDMYKRRVLIPYFQMSSEKSVRSYALHPSTLLPWLAQPSAQGGNGSVRIGGYASVKTVKIDPDSHDFTSLLRRVRSKETPDRNNQVYT
jgi:hypothetical protein